MKSRPINPLLATTSRGRLVAGAKPGHISITAVDARNRVSQHLELNETEFEDLVLHFLTTGLGFKRARAALAKLADAVPATAEMNGTKTKKTKPPEDAPVGLLDRHFLNRDLLIEVCADQPGFRIAYIGGEALLSDETLSEFESRIAGLGIEVRELSKPKRRRTSHGKRRGIQRNKSAAELLMVPPPPPPDHSVGEPEPENE